MMYPKANYIRFFSNSRWSYIFPFILTKENRHYALMPLGLTIEPIITIILSLGNVLSVFVLIIFSAQILIQSVIVKKQD